MKTRSVIFTMAMVFAIGLSSCSKDATAEEDQLYNFSTEEVDLNLDAIDKDEIDDRDT